MADVCRDLMKGPLVASAQTCADADTGFTVYALKPTEFSCFLLA